MGALFSARAGHAQFPVYRNLQQTDHHFRHPDPGTLPMVGWPASILVIFLFTRQIDITPPPAARSTDKDQE